MIFNGINNQTVELNIINYEYPEFINEAYLFIDSNWLMIQIKVQSDFGYWEAVDPALLTCEFQKMIIWFEDLSKNIEPVTTELIFTEPSFILLLNNRHDEKIKKIRIELEMELKMKGLFQECYIEISANNRELKRISNDLKKELSKFPAR